VAESTTTKSTATDRTAQQVRLALPEQVNLQAELNALAAVLTSLDDPITSGVVLKGEAEAYKAP